MQIAYGKRYVPVGYMYVRSYVPMAIEVVGYDLLTGRRIIVFFFWWLREWNGET